jgi:hypothetical protein
LVYTGRPLVEVLRAHGVPVGTMMGSSVRRHASATASRRSWPTSITPRRSSRLSPGSRRPTWSHRRRNEPKPGRSGSSTSRLRAGVRHVVNLSQFAAAADSCGCREPCHGLISAFMTGQPHRHRPELSGAQQADGWSDQERCGVAGQCDLDQTATAFVRTAWAEATTRCRHEPAVKQARTKPPIALPARTDGPSGRASTLADPP